MKGKLLKRLLENKRLLRTGCGLMAAAVMMTGGLYVYDTQNSYMPELVEFIDEGEAVISDEDVPLASAPKTVTQTATATNRGYQYVKLAKASTGTFTKKLPTTKTTSTKTASKTVGTTKTTVSITDVTTIAQVEYYYKGLATKKIYVVKRLDRTTKTTTQQVATAAAAPKVLNTVAGTSSSVVKKNLVVNSALPKADAKLRNAFTTMGFTLKVDSTVTYSGKFDAKSRTITMRKENDDAIYHEFGHFLAFIGGINTTKAGGDGVKVYEAEKAKYTGVNKAYVNQNADEYFAESYRDYCTNKAALQKSRPQTYALIQKALNNVTDAQIAKFMKVYAVYWK